MNDLRISLSRFFDLEDRWRKVLTCELKRASLPPLVGPGVNGGRLNDMGLSSLLVNTFEVDGWDQEPSLQLFLDSIKANTPVELVQKLKDGPTLWSEFRREVPDGEFYL